MAANVEVGDPVTADLLNTILAGSVNRPIVRLVAQAAQALTNATDVALTFGASSEVVDTDGYHNEVTNNTRITPTRAGWFKLTATVYLPSSASYTAIQIAIRQNGATLMPSLSRHIPPLIGGARSQTVIMTVQANGTTDYFEAVAQQISGSSQNTLASGSNSSTFECEFIRDL